MSITAGAEHSLAATDDGKAYSWGWGRYGNLGDGHTSDRRALVAALCTAPACQAGLHRLRVCSTCA